jgi:hypothetical protein
LAAKRGADTARGYRRAMVTDAVAVFVWSAAAVALTATTDGRGLDLGAV